METNLLIEGFKFLGLGMGAVFLFLAIMIFAMNIMSTVLSKFYPEPHPLEDSAEVNTQNNKKVVAAITAAIKHHRG